MIIYWPVDYVDTTVQTSEVVKENGHSVKVPCFKRCRRNLYINTDTLAPRDKFWVDIALEYQKIVGNPKYFIMLRSLFKEGDWTKIKHDAITPVMAAGWYFENASGEPISKAQFFAELRGLPEMIELPNRTLVPANLSEDQARASGIPDLVPLHHTDFAFDSSEIDILNRFVDGVYDLLNSSLCRQASALSLNLSKSIIEKNITQEQYLASLIIFRKLYANDEPAGFKQAVKKLQDTRKVHHPLVGAVNRANKKYNALLSQKIIANCYAGHYVKGVLNGTWCPSGKELIQALFNVNCIHQGDKDTCELEQKIRDAIPVKAIVDFSLWMLLQQLCEPITVVAKYAEAILHTLGSLTARPKSPDITNNELEFKLLLTKMIPVLSEIIWREQTSPLQYCGQAEAQIIEKLKLPNDYFSNMNIARK